MRWGVREICDVVFKPLAAVDIGNQHFDAMQPVLYLDTAKTSSLEGAATTVYAQGGQGNPRLIGWDGEKTITFTIEDALLSTESFAMLSGAGVVKGMGDRQNLDDLQKVYVHQTFDLVVESGTVNEVTSLYAKLPAEVRNGKQIIATIEAPIYATVLDSAGAPKHYLSAIKPDEIFIGADKAQAKILNRGLIVKTDNDQTLDANLDVYFKLDYVPAEDYPEVISGGVRAGDTVRIDCYCVYGTGATELQIDAETFAGYYYIEASTLFRDEATGQDFPAEFVIPRGKIQSNFTFTMVNSGDPSTFTFTIDAFPAYTKFNKAKKVMAVLQVIDPEAAHHNYADYNVLGHNSTRKDVDSKEYYDEIYNRESVFDEKGSNDNTALDEVFTKGKAILEADANPTDAAKAEFLRLFGKLTDAEERIVKIRLEKHDASKYPSASRMSRLFN